MKTTIDGQEVEKFNKLANEWWDSNGKFKLLHSLNPVRLEYIIYNIKRHFNINIDNFVGQNIKGLDIGCGGGLLCEPLSRLGIEMIGVDASENNIKIADLHAKNNNLNIQYLHDRIENLNYSDESFDIIFAMEIIEHVADVEFFINCCSKLLKPNGIIFLSTLNRTIKALIFAIWGAEYLLRLLPTGTHEWKKFIQPAELELNLRRNNLLMQDLQGFTMNPITSKWSLASSINVNYMLYATKTVG